MLISFTALILKASKYHSIYGEKKPCTFINIYVFIHMYIITFTTSHIFKKKKKLFNIQFQGKTIKGFFKIKYSTDCHEWNINS